jgi:hypothetical protein
MNPTRSSFFTSSAIAWFCSRTKLLLLLLCFTGWWLGSTFSLWTITEGSIPGISLWLHPNTSLLRQRKATNSSLILWESCDPTRIFFFESLISNSSRSSTVSPICDCYFASSLLFSPRLTFLGSLFRVML